jgi:hypothetical protein
MRSHSPARSRHLGAALAAGALALTAACGGGDDGGEPESAGASSASSGPSESPSQTASPSPGEQPAEPFTDSFDDTDSGWRTTDTEGYFARYDGGAFRVGTRTNASYAAPAPVVVSDLAPDHAIRVDVDTTEDEGMSDLGAYGITCWNRPTEDGAAEAGFLLYVDHESAYIGLWGAFSGNYEEIAKEDLGGALEPGEPNHLRATCRPGTSEDGTTRAELALQVNGDEVVSASYAQGGGSADWEVGDGVGLVAAGAGADVLFDNVRVAPAT